MAIWNKYFWKQSRLHWGAWALLRAVFAIYSQCVVSRWRRPATARPGRAASWRKTTASSTATCSAPASTGSASSQAPAHVRPSHPVSSFAWVDSRLYPVLSDYFQLYWCLASIKYKIDNFILTFKHDSLNWSYALFSEEPEARRASEGGSMISARDPLQGRALGVPPGHGEVLIIIIVVCQGRPVYPNVVSLFVTVTCWSQIIHCPQS